MKINATIQNLCKKQKTWIILKTNQNHYKKQKNKKNMISQTMGSRAPIFLYSFWNHVFLFYLFFQWFCLVFKIIHVFLFFQCFCMILLIFICFYKVLVHFQHLATKEQTKNKQKHLHSLMNIDTSIKKKYA